MQQTAFRLCCLGFSIIPLGDAGTPQAKQPRIPWQQYQTAPASEEQVWEWWETWPSANIGVICGPVSDCVVIDCDDAAAVAWHEEHCVGTPVRVNTSRGAHFYYRYPSGSHQAQQLRALKKELQDNGLHVDVQADGRYVVGPGSVHESGKQYVLEPCEALELWEQNAVLEFALVEKRQHVDLSSIDLSGIRSTYGQIDKGGRNNSLASYAGALVKAGMSYQNVLAEVSAHNQAMCNPPLKEREVVATVSSIFKTDARNRKQDSAQDTNMDGLKVVTDDPLAAFSLPDHIVNPGGLLQDIMDYTEASSVRTHRYFALAGAIALMGTLLGQRLCTETGLTTNLYVLAIGWSASGKDAPKRTLGKLLHMVASNAYGGSDVASDVAILTTLEKSPRVCFVFDEIGMFLKACKSPNSARAGVVKLLTEIYSCYDTPYAKRYANADNNKIIPWQALSVLGLSVPDEFYGALTDGENSNGFLARVLVFESTDTPGARNESVCREVPERLVSGLKNLWAIKGGEETPDVSDTGSVSLQSVAKPTCVCMDSAAREFHRASTHNFDVRAIEATMRGDNAAASLLGRVAEHAAKLALVHAASRLGGSVVTGNVTLDDITWGWSLAGLLTERMLVQLQTSVHETDFEAWQQRITRAILKHVAQKKAKGVEKPGASRYIIERALSGVSSRIVDELLDKLVKQNKLRKVEGWKESENARRVSDLYCLVTDDAE